jgi:hypothetical protein
MYFFGFPNIVAVLKYLSLNVLSPFCLEIWFITTNRCGDHLTWGCTSSWLFAGEKGWENTTKMGDDKNLVAKPERKTTFLMHLKETTCGSSDFNSIWIPSRKPNPLFLIVR